MHFHSMIFQSSVEYRYIHVHICRHAYSHEDETYYQYHDRALWTRIMHWIRSFHCLDFQYLCSIVCEIYNWAYNNAFEYQLIYNKTSKLNIVCLHAENRHSYTMTIGDYCGQALAKAKYLNACITLFHAWPSKWNALTRRCKWMYLHVHYT